jgi:hypothetical protein
MSSESTCVESLIPNAACSEMGLLGNDWIMRASTPATNSFNNGFNSLTGDWELMET